MPQIEFDDNGVTLGHSTRREPAWVGVTTLSCFTLRNVNLEDALEEVYSDIMKVLASKVKVKVSKKMYFISI